MHTQDKEDYWMISVDEFIEDEAVIMWRSPYANRRLNRILKKVLKDD